jgi:hypothetical protein
VTTRGGIDASTDPGALLAELCEFPPAAMRHRSERPRHSGPMSCSSLFRRFGSPVERKHDLDGRSCAFGALEGDCAAESLDAVTQPDEPGTAGRIGAPDAVVADHDVQGFVGLHHVDVHGCRL